ncbi:DUF6350 family protein [Streptomyces sp. NBC_01218]|uniref:cell division protein PerM n=1 Tax=Streptomyces sp. NBC_01218 TaxID=2903780 RepID=UPI002E1200B0|nr:DUF6350 family protein [Streptomyces sp. NBC_01218]
MAGVTQVTDRSPMLSSGRGRAAALASALLRGAIAAGLGLAALTVVVLGLWISSPYSDDGPGRSVRTAAALWLLSHGAELLRTDTLSGVPAPVATVPLLLTALPVWLLHRAARDALDATDLVDAVEDRPPSASAVCCAVVTGYLLVIAGAVAFVRSGPLRVDTGDSATLAFPLVAVVAGATAAGVWTASGRPMGATPSWAPLRVQEAVARTLFRDRAEAATRSAAAGIAVLLGGGALLVAVGLVRHRALTAKSFLALSDDLSGQIAVLLLALALVPNAAVWAASYGLGPGFSLGTGATVAPLGFYGDPALPRFPLLAALPDPGPGTAVDGLAGAVPLMAAVAVAWFTVRRAAPRDGAREEAWNAGETALVTGLAAVCCGAGTAALAALSGGPMGTRALAEFGPVWWTTGAAAVIWTAVLGVPLALLMRIWRLRERAWGWRSETPDAVPAVGFAGHRGRTGTGTAAGAAARPVQAFGAWRSDPFPGMLLAPPAGGTTAEEVAAAPPTDAALAGAGRAWWKPRLPRRKTEAPDAGPATPTVPAAPAASAAPTVRVAPVAPVAPAERVIPEPGPTPAPDLDRADPERVADPDHSADPEHAAHTAGPTERRPEPQPEPEPEPYDPPYRPEPSGRPTNEGSGPTTDGAAT